MSLADAAPRVTATVLTHRGAQREHNEDAVAVGGCTFTGVSSSTPYTVTVPILPDDAVVVAVADGLGGHAAGEVASAHTVQRVAATGSALASSDRLVSALQAVSSELYQMGAQDPQKQGLGTTVVGLVLTVDTTLWFNVGDSRVYAISGGYAGQLSIDDTAAGAFAEPGQSPPPTGIVTQVLGSVQPLPMPHVGVEPLGTDGVYLLCSDGLTDLVGVEQLELILAAEPDNDARAVTALWAAAMNNGGRDNITIVLARRLSSGG